MENKKPNHICKVCGVPYYACDSCDKHKTFKSMCESENHYNIYNTVVLFSRGLYSKEEACRALNSCDLSDVLTYKESVRNIINNIMKNDIKKNKRKSVAIKESVNLTDEPVVHIEEKEVNTDDNDDNFDTEE